MPADRAEDSYSIYSLLMPGETLSSLPAEQGATWAIADVTVNDADRSPAFHLRDNSSHRPRIPVVQ